MEESDEGGTVLSYTVNAQVGGKLAQIGSRLIDSTAKKLSREFFDKFTELVDGGTDTSGDSSEKLENLAEQEKGTQWKMITKLRKTSIQAHIGRSGCWA